MTFTFRASDKFFLTNESQQKIDIVLAKVFAIFSLFSLIVFLLSSHYKGWLVRVQIMKSLRENRFSLYEKSLLNYFQFVFCRFKFFRKSEEVRELEEEMEKAVSSLDLIRMRKEIDELKAERDRERNRSTSENEVIQHDSHESEGEVREVEK